MNDEQAVAAHRWPEPVPGENARIAARREKARAALADRPEEKQPLLNATRVGLALSGGGVRSATFCFGLVRGMAQRGLLPRIDYLSTVSGGGYTGALLGRLIACLGLRAANEALRRNDTLLLWWLRGNGRYLTPAGSRDLGMAVASYLRAWVAIQFEVGTACIVVGGVVLAPHLLYYHAGWPDARIWSSWQTPWWLLAAVVWLLLAPGAMAAYWLARDPQPGPARHESALRRWAFTILLGVVAIALLATALGLPLIAQPLAATPWLLVPGGVLASMAVQQALLLASLHDGAAKSPTQPSARVVAEARNRLTRRLRLFTGIALVPAALGALDLASWKLMTLVLGTELLWSGVGVGGVVLALRVLAEPLQKLAQRTDPEAARQWLPKLLNALGILAALFLLVGWLALLQAWVFDNQMAGQMQAWPAWWRAAAVLALATAWIVWTGRNSDMPNASSLHGFYRARLTRAYLSVGNPKRFDRTWTDGDARRVTPASPVTDQAIEGVVGVTDVLEGDDLSLSNYRPEEAGGPIHLVNTCLNQTRDDASGLYNADRKGMLVTATASGLEVGPRGYLDAAASSDPGTLGRWVAMSGAAAAPGAGSYTATGLALLMSLLGVRLGYWVPRPANAPGDSPSRCWRLLVKQVMLGSEGVASFRGKSAPWWYLSDGGHFENTGVYPLIKRELDFIIVADCGADPDYRFGDLENLIRKARIDFDAEIEFYTREDAIDLLQLQGGELTVLSPEHVADNYSARGVMLARICYHSSDPTRAHAGTLLVVKPNLHSALDVDLLAYAQRNPGFPQQGTGDQFFDEAQWESYHRLGEDFGRALDETWLAQLPGWREAAHREQFGTAAPLQRLRPAEAPAGTNKLAPWRKSARAAAIGATLGVGASGTLLLSVWQGLDQLSKQRASEQAEVRQMLAAVSDEMKKFDGRCTVFSESAAWQLKSLRDRDIGGRLANNESETVTRLLDFAREECAKAPDASADCAQAWRRNHSGGVCDALVDRGRGSAQLSYLTKAADIPVLLADAATLASAAPASTRPAPLTPPAADSAAAPTPSVAAPAAPASSPPDEIKSGPARPASAAEPAPAPEPSLEACSRGDKAAPIRVFIQIYDEASRRLADELRAQLRDARDPVIAPGVENVTRTADLRNQRAPFLWAVPTLIVHNDNDRACAEELAQRLKDPIVKAYAGTQGFSIRALPKSQKAAPGVIEVWLPRVEATQSSSEY